jgi:hypothetical protein
MSAPRVELSTSEDFEPSERLRAALDEVIRAYDEQLASPDSDDEVVGFGAGLQIGVLGGNRGGTRGKGWNDGCWGYNLDDGTCGWFQSGDTSCVGYSEW